MGNISRRFFYFVLLCFCLSFAGAASYNSCRMVPFDKQLYHRRVQKDPSWGASHYVLRYPEVLIDRSAMISPKVISCIRCQDLQKMSERENSICKVVAGGVGHTFVKIHIVSQPNAGYDYDIKIIGH